MALKNIKTATEPTEHAPAPEKVEPKQTSLVALEAFSALKLFDIPAPTESSDLLPQVKIPYAIEMGEVFKAADVFKVGLFDGKAFQQLCVPYVMTVIAAREATRKLVAKADEKGKAQNTYERAYKSLGTGFDKSHAVFEAHLQDPTAQRGISYIVGIIDAEGNVAIAELPAFKVLKDYWGRPLHQKSIQARAGIKVLVGDHSENLTTSANDPNKKYLGPKKFVQWQTVTLSDAQVSALASALEVVKGKFEAWSKQ